LADDVADDVVVVVASGVGAATIPVAGSGSPSYSPRSDSSWQSTIDEQGSDDDDDPHDFGPRFRDNDSMPAPVEHAPVLGGPGGNSWTCPSCTFLNPPPDNPTPLDSDPDAVLCNFATCVVCEHAVGSHVWEGGEEHEQITLQLAAMAEHAAKRRRRNPS